MYIVSDYFKSSDTDQDISMATTLFVYFFLVIDLNKN